MHLDKKAQVALEALIILGILLIGAILLGIYYFQEVAQKKSVDINFVDDNIFKDKTISNTGLEGNQLPT